MGFARTGSNPVAVVFPQALQRGLSNRDFASGGGAHASLAQWLERSAVNRKVAGSIPAGGVSFF